MSRCVQCGERLVSLLCLEPALPSCPASPSSLESPFQTSWTCAHKSCPDGRCAQVLGAVAPAQSRGTCRPRVGSVCTPCWEVSSGRERGLSPGSCLGS